MRIFSRQIVIALFALLLPLAASAQGDNPFIGVWDLDKPDSNFGSIPIPENMIRTYANASGGAFMYLLVTINADESIGGSSATYDDKKEKHVGGLEEDRVAHDALNPFRVSPTDHDASDSRGHPGGRRPSQQASRAGVSISADVRFQRRPLT